MKKYMVMETGLSYAVVMDEEGCFYKVPNLNYKVGETLSDIVVFEDRRSGFSARRAIFRFVALVACICILAFGGFWLWNDPVSTVLIEINPSVLIEINRFGFVVDVEGANYDGTLLIKDYERNSNKPEEVAKEIAALAIEKGYGDETPQIRITADKNEAAIIAKLKAYFNEEAIIIPGGEPWHDISPEQEPSGIDEPEQEVRITLEEAVRIAEEHLGIEGAVCTKNEFDAEDNRYEVEFTLGNTEYEYSIDIYGNIIEVKTDTDEDDD